MKLVVAYIKPHKVADVSLALHHVSGLTGLSISDVEGWGHGKLRAERQHHADQVADFEVHRKVEVVCVDGLADEVVRTIQGAAHTGLPGDGMIFVTSVEQVTRISSGDHGDAAI